ncbi:unnamed protein product [Musa acuminata subsp. malaccensis]|uniref:(wild Malaysian banana) hypothetical protein n=1 Tax=Musa acuminata subsp. malaccensis TaxID=214687 RepID=A0A804JLB4_MUSAM|nr:unnamed protein product [Musa acuminata subsp. malaccensis]
MNDANAPSDAGDVNAMMMIEAWYKIKRNWMGDPCSPKIQHLESSKDHYSVSFFKRELNLSSSGLTGEINKSFASLGAIDTCKATDLKLISFLFLGKAIEHGKQSLAFIGANAEFHVEARHLF